MIFFSLFVLQLSGDMATSSNPAASPSKKGTKKEKAEETVERFSVGQFVEKTEVLPADKLNIDRDLSHGQVRTVDEGHVQDLMEHYNVNEPDELQMTVVKDRGIPISAWAPAFCLF